MRFLAPTRLLVLTLDGTLMRRLGWCCMTVISVYVVENVIIVCRYEFLAFRKFSSQSWDSPVCVTTDWTIPGLRGRNSSPGGSRIFRSSFRLDQIWGLPSLLANGYLGGGAFPPK
jgi:hypothetical protein